MSTIKEFIISDESVNRFGFKVKTSGINIDKFVKNPVMFYNHNREGGVIGRWENVHSDNGRLIATPVFDETDELGHKISGKVENGFIRAASIGIEPIDIDANDNTVILSELVECSICDVPSNGNALMLYQNGQQVKSKEFYLNLNLIKNQNPMKDEDVKKIIAALLLKDDASIDDILSAINSLSAAESPAAIVENAIKMNAIKPYEKSGLLKMAATDFSSFAEYMEKRKNEYSKGVRGEMTKLVNAAARDGRLLYPASSDKSKEFLVNAFSQDFEAGKIIIDNLNKRVMISDLINRGSSAGDRSNWKLNDYRKKAPQELAANPSLYDRLLEEEMISKKTK
jgi:hypothetical protein